MTQALESKTGGHARSVRWGVMAMVVALAGWGSLAVTSTIALRGLGPLTLMGCEVAVAAFVLGAMCLVRGRRLPRPSAALIVLAVLEPYGIDANGCLMERTWVGGTEVIIRRDDVPESDVTTIDGIRVTTALRTVIDLASA